MKVRHRWAYLAIGALIVASFGAVISESGGDKKPRTHATTLAPYRPSANTLPTCTDLLNNVPATVMKRDGRTFTNTTTSSSILPKGVLEVDCVIFGWAPNGAYGNVVIHLNKVTAASSVTLSREKMLGRLANQILSKETCVDGTLVKAGDPPKSASCEVYSPPVNNGSMQLAAHGSVLVVVKIYNLVQNVSATVSRGAQKYFLTQTFNSVVPML